VTAIRNFFRSSIKINTISVKNDTAIVKRTTTGNICTKQNEKFFVEDTTFFICKYTQDRWKISHYFQYIDNSKNCGKFLPPNTNQHITAGPYSPVLEVVPGSIVVISGQVAVDENGNTIGNTIEEQAAYTLENCKVQLKTADCTFSDVFKVNVFLDDLGMWERFNTVYEQTLPDPKPVRTAIQAKLLSDYIVEIELWAVKTKSNDITIQQQSFII
jgi:2-iminobutanoate/2-iminopropanoate deaminase